MAEGIGQDVVGSRKIDWDMMVREIRYDVMGLYTCIRKEY